MKKIILFLVLTAATSTYAQTYESTIDFENVEMNIAKKINNLCDVTIDDNKLKSAFKPFVENAYIGRIYITDHNCEAVYKLNSIKNVTLIIDSEIGLQRTCEYDSNPYHFWQNKNFNISIVVQDTSNLKMTANASLSLHDSCFDDQR